MKNILYLFVSLFLFLDSSSQIQLYGVTTAGGTNGIGVGTISHYTPSTSAFELDWSFDSYDNGAIPYSLVLAGNKFYGTTLIGGLNSKGVLFEWDPVLKSYTKKIDFDNTNGANPTSAMIPANGKLYGVTRNGGGGAGGVIFEWEPVTNILTKKFDFGTTTMVGAQPLGSLTLSNGKFYGMTIGGGNYGRGVIFDWDPVTNVYNTRIHFDKLNGGYPEGSLTVANDKFYGMTSIGGTNDMGVIFEWDPLTNVYSKKIDFNGANGTNPAGSLTLYSGKFYGMTFTGGANNEGIIFEWDPVTNILSKKFDFDGLKGKYPPNSLLLSSGKFYGATQAGGANNKGVIFQWDPVTNKYTKTVDFNGINGREPTGNFVEYFNNSLPIKLLSFQALLQNNNNANLQWQIASAEESSIFELQRSFDGQNFISINQQKGYPTVTAFSYTDNALSNGTYYYRLKIKDKDGKETYSNIAIIKVGGKEQSIATYPNPVKRGEALQISLQNISANQIQIINSVGQVIYNNVGKLTGSVSIHITTSFAPGQYLLKVTNDDKVVTHKILIQ